MQPDMGLLLTFDVSSLQLLQIVNGRHRQAMFALHHLIGAAVESASQWRRSSMFIQSVVKGMQLFGALCIESI